MNKKYLYIAGALALVIIAYLVFSNKQKNKVMPQPEQSQEQQANTTPPKETTTTTTNKSTTSKKLSYGDAIAAYKFRFQFVNCSANPGTMSVKSGTAVMLDNRDKVAHTIKVNGITTKIAPLDYVVIYPKSVTSGTPTAASPNMTCDGGGSGVLNVEK